jgi:hypothetical protein
MASEAKKASSLAVANTMGGGDYLLSIINVSSVTNNALISAATLFSNVAVPHITVGNNAVSTANLVIRSGYIPLNSTSNGVQGQIAWDSSYHYVCVANNTWKRSPLTTW